MTELTTHATEESTFIITATFKDEDDNLVAPTSASWTLSDEDGSVINSREDVTISSPSSAEDIVLHGDDLVMQSGEIDKADRILTVSATYDSDAGTGLELKAEVKFYIDGLLNV